MMSDPCWRSKNTEALVGIAAVEGVRIGPSPAWLLAQLATATTRRDSVDRWDQGVRAMLRAGGFRPSGRNRPAHEFLSRVCGGVATISNVVDVNNIVSLTHRLPASVIDAVVSEGSLVIREGEAGERYVFNRSGQELDLEGLLIVCSATGAPIASPVKDSLVAHVTERTSAIVFCAYGSSRMMDASDMEAMLDDFMAMTARAAGGGEAGRWILSCSGVERLGANR